jgi:hypothetical protein
MRQVTGEDAGKTTSLNDKLAEQLEGGAVSLSSADIAASSQERPRGEATQGDVKAKAAKLDPIVESAGLADEQPKQLAEEVDQAEESRAALTQMIADTDDMAVELTRAEREAFVESLISGERFSLPFSLYGGKVTGIIRARSQAETTAIIRCLNEQRRDGEILDMLEYATHLRNVLLAAQIEELNGTTFAELQAPLRRIVKGKDKIEEPGWLEQSEYWASQQEGLNSALYNALRTFEKKYWVMVDNANDQNFLNPEGSTSG